MPPSGRGSELVSLSELQRQIGPDGNLLRVVKATEKNCAFFRHMHWKVSNSPNGQVNAMQSSLPQVYRRRLNEGVPASKGTTSTVTEGAAIFAGESKVDKTLARMSGDAAAYRMQKDDLFISQAIPQEFNRAVFYDNPATDIANLGGLTPRLNSLSGKYGSQIVNSSIAHSGQDMTSVWAMVSSPNTVYGFVPRGQPSAIDYVDRGESSAVDAKGNTWYPLTSSFEMHAGLAVEDPRYIARLANIDTGAIAKTGSLLIQDLTSLVFRLQDLNSGEPMMFANRLVLEYLFQQALDTVKNSTLRIEDDLENRQKIVKFMGIPIYMDEMILNTEDVVA